MTSIIRQTAVWTGSPGLPGYTQMYHEVGGDQAAAAQAGHNDLNDFFDTLVNIIPADIDVTVDPIYDVVDVVTGAITGQGTVGDPTAPTVGGYVGSWARQVGVLVEWLTDSFVGGRRLKGRTYVVPLGNVSDDDGTLPGGTVTTVETAAAIIVDSSANFVVWHRPVGGAGGSISSVASSIVRDRAAILRSRMV